MEVALNVPFDTSEITEIAVAEFKKRLSQLGPIQGMKEYARFELDFNVGIKLFRTGESGAGKETLAWGHVENGSPEGVTMFIESDQVKDSKFVSKDPNEERQSRDMPLTVETTDGRGGKTRRKVRVQG